MNKRSLGGGYEKAAAAYLQENGYKILQMNYRCRVGEADIVARDGKYLVFVEVKYRERMSGGSPLAAVGFRKQERISRVAAWYLTEHQLPEYTAVRFDVVGITPGEIRLIRNAFDSVY